MTPRRITIARDGAVRLNGKVTRWRVARESGMRRQFWSVIGPKGRENAWGDKSSSRAYLAGLSDAELMGP